MDHEELRALLQPFARNLALQWGLQLVPDDRVQPLVAVSSSRAKRSHALSYAAPAVQHYAATPEGGKVVLSALLHGLCQASLGERLDPCFSDPTFHYPETMTPSPALSYLNNYALAIWVDDQLEERWPQMLYHELQTTERNLSRLILDREWQGLLPPGLPYTLGWHRAELQRRNRPSIDHLGQLRMMGFQTTPMRKTIIKTSADGNMPVEEYCDLLRKQQGEPKPRTWDDIGMISSKLSGLPRLPDDREGALIAYGAAFNDLLAGLRLPYRVRREDSPDEVIWALSR